MVIAQAIIGVITDKNSGKPIASAAVYFNNTTIGTSSNDLGEFEIEYNKNINTPLVISFLGYESVRIEQPILNETYTILLEEKISTLNEVNITNNDWPRALKLKEFKKHFLGTSKNAKSCVILNENDIILRFNHSEKTLIAYVDKPLKIINNRLKYKVDFKLSNFYVKYAFATLKEQLYKSSFFEGTSFYTSFDEDKATKKNRLKTYMGSRVHFLKSLANRNLKENKFVLFYKSFAVDPNKYLSFIKLDDKHTKIKVSKDPKQLSVRIKNPDLPYLKPIKPASFNVLYDKKHQSIFTPNVFEFTVDKFGNSYPTSAISFGGYIGDLRFADDLPLDYK